ncbi:hypothetical protein MMC27_001837 [Xylographa pallens]|nr:hypothetical protein [Xylographa pallens]
MSAQTLLGIIDAAATTRDVGLIVYAPGDVKNGNKISYSELKRRAHHNSCLLQQIAGLSPGSPVLLHFRDHIDNIEWFWSTILAGFLPTISTPFTNHTDQRIRHMLHLQNLLESPLCITRQSLLSDFEGQDALRICTVEELKSCAKQLNLRCSCLNNPSPEALAALMLTSGSTGNAKAVCLTHTQIISAVLGKSSALGIKPNDVVLNWIGLDHVAGLIESHITAMLLGLNQIHVQAPDLLSDPRSFLDLLSKHKVTFSFAPNFFLTRLISAFMMVDKEANDLNFTHFRTLVSGGEANVVETCCVVNKFFRAFGATRNVICPGFGMTETCAGSTYSTSCPESDLRASRTFASLGICNPGMEIRITIPESGILAAVDEPGQLELRGSVVFKRYYNNLTATANAFTTDGWFITGDLAYIDSAGHLNLSGRIKEIMNINGMKYSPHELETTIEKSKVTGIVVGTTLAFASRPRDFPTEQIYIVYVPSYEHADASSRLITHDAVCKATMLCTGVRPYVLPLDNAVLKRSTLGKLTRTKLQMAFERGDFRSYQEINDETLRNHKRASINMPTTHIEQTIFNECVCTLEPLDQELRVDSNMFGMGMTSIDLLKLKQRLQVKLDITDISLLTIMMNPTVRSLAIALLDIQKPHKYNPVVVLQEQGSKTPLWLVHPGVGEVLVFLALAKHFTDRPIYALRARGFEGEDCFHDIAEAVGTYHQAIKRAQPQGPYAIAGYSYGSMLAFEISKAMNVQKDGEVKFLGAFNLPPHIKSRMQQLDWVECLLNLSYFLDLVEPKYAQSISPELHKLRTKEESIKSILNVSDSIRLASLGLDAEKLLNWTNLACNLQGMARNYEPCGQAACIDVFCATPLAAVANSRQEWMDNYLSKWSDFSATPPRFHNVDGEHYTMIGPMHVSSFQRTLKSALEERGL